MKHAVLKYVRKLYETNTTVTKDYIFIYALNIAELAT